MIKNNRKIFFLSGMLFILLLLLIVISVNGIKIGNFEILSLQSIAIKRDEVKLAETNLELENTKYDIALNKLNEEKEEFQTEKAKYEAISEETVKIINQVNTKEKYSIEYIWIKLGNYADANNLSIVVAEPGNAFNGEKVSEEEKENSMFKIQVSGNYVDIASFIYQIENDTELKFKLDNIKMEYVSGTTIRTTFSVKDILIIK